MNKLSRKHYTLLTWVITIVMIFESVVGSTGPFLGTHCVNPEHVYEICDATPSVPKNTLLPVATPSAPEDEIFNENVSSPIEPIITDWYWTVSHSNDSLEMTVSNDTPGNPVMYEDVISYLPDHITITYQSSNSVPNISEDIDLNEYDNMEEECEIIEWVCDDYPIDGAYTGTYLFEPIISHLFPENLNKPLLLLTVEDEQILEVLDLFKKLPLSEEVIRKTDSKTMDRLEKHQSIILIPYETDNKTYINSLSEYLHIAYDAYLNLNDGQKNAIGNIDTLTDLIWLLDGSWEYQYPSFQEGNVLVKEIHMLEPDVLSETSELPKDPDTVYNGNIVTFPFELLLQSDPDKEFKEGTLLFEILLPFGTDEASFVTEELYWLDGTEEPLSAVMESRNIDGKTISCQILKGSYRFEKNEDGLFKVPEHITHNISVQLLDPKPGAELYIAVNPVIASENIATKDIYIESKHLTVLDQKLVKEQQDNYEYFLTYIESLDAEDYTESELIPVSDALQRDITECFKDEGLSKVQYDVLTEALVELTYGGFDHITEYAYGFKELQMRLNNDIFVPEYELTDIRSLTFNIPKPRATNTNVTAVSKADDMFSEGQITYKGGSTESTDGKVEISKTIHGTDIENIFNITLTVRTQEKIEEITSEPDMAVVMIMDISNSMNSTFGKTTRYRAAIKSAESFINKFAEETGNISKLGFVAFNSNGYKIFDLQHCNEENGMADDLIAEMKAETEAIVLDSGYADDPTRYTNIEAGLQLGYDMLKEANNSSKYIVFLSDGFPTTYLKAGTTTYQGYSTVSTSGTVGKDGVFYDSVLKAYCIWGTSYSDKAAIKARTLATKIKNDGVQIFSIGVDVAGQTIKQYITQSEGFTGASVVDRGNISEKDFEIGAATDTAAFSSWLKGSKTDNTIGIGSGYYYDSSDENALMDAFSDIFEEIISQRKEASHASWVAKDPIPTITGSPETIDFIGFYDQNGNLVTTNAEGVTDPNILASLKGSGNEGSENTVAFENDDYVINWDLKESGYTSNISGNVTDFYYELNYCVRLRNEGESFREGSSYPTNATTTLTYNILETIDNEIVISQLNTLQFEIPSVTGYTVPLSFKKVDTHGNPLAGALFTLKHQPDCELCHTDETEPVDLEELYATSQQNGLVLFNAVPSGHKYEMLETPPVGYILNGNSYHLTVSNDVLTVEVTDANGNYVEWDSDNPEIVNIPYCKLQIVKNIDTKYNHYGESTFLFRIEGYDIFGEHHLMYKSISIPDGNTGSITIEGIPCSDNNGYKVTEISNSRYKLYQVSGENLISGSGNAGTRSGVADLNNYDDSTIIFHNNLEHWDKVSHSKSIINLVPAGNT